MEADPSIEGPDSQAEVQALRWKPMASNPRLPRLGSPLPRALCSGASGPLASGTWRPRSHPSEPSLADLFALPSPRAGPCAFLCSHRRSGRRRPPACAPAAAGRARARAGRCHHPSRRRRRRQFRRCRHQRRLRRLSEAHSHGVGHGERASGSFEYPSLSLPPTPQASRSSAELEKAAGRRETGHRARGTPRVCVVRVVPCGCCGSPCDLGEPTRSRSDGCCTYVSLQNVLSYFIHHLGTL